MRGRDIYFRRRGGPRPISRKWYFRGPTFPESNNTESSFNKGSATIYRGHVSHSHLSASTAYIAIPLPVLSILPQPSLPPPPRNPFHSGTHPPLLVATILFLTISLSSIREYFFPRLLFLSFFFSLFLSAPIISRAHAIVSDCAFTLRKRYFSTEPLHYFNERDPFRSRTSPPEMTSPQ